MTIVNEGSTPIDLNLATNKTYLQFVVPGGGFDTGYTYTQPTALVGGGTQLGVGMTDQLVFTITQTGNTTGIIVVSGRVEGNDAGGRVRRYLRRRPRQHRGGAGGGGQVRGDAHVEAARDGGANDRVGRARRGCQYGWRDR